MQLAIDTSTDTASLALVRDGTVVAELTWRCGQNHTQQLLPNVEYLLRRFSVSPQDLTGIIVARGPGSFNGLRVGVSAAKGLAFSLGIPIVGISSLETEAYQHAGTGLPICPVLNAGRGEVCAAVYRRRRGRWLQLVPEHVGSVEALCSGVGSKTVFCGEHVPAIAAQLRQYLGSKAVVPSATTGLRRASYLAELGLRRLAAGDTDDVATLQPAYLRRPSITTARHR